MGWNPALQSGGDLAFVSQRLDRSNPEDYNLGATSSDSSAFAAGILLPSPFVKVNEKVTVVRLKGVEKEKDVLFLTFRRIGLPRIIQFLMGLCLKSLLQITNWRFFSFVFCLFF